MEIIGYSERGLLNSLFYEIRYSPNSLQLLSEFLRIFSFPCCNINFDVKDFKVLIEQSFSDFGDSDSLLLIDGFQSKQSIFIEAKVKTSQRRYWSIDEEFKAFQEGIKKKKVSSSNLFVQLYYKHRLVRELQKGNENWRRMELDFPECLLTDSKKMRKIGSNEVVLKAVELLRQYCSDAYFIGLVPEDDFKIKRFYEEILNDFKPNGFPEWDIKDWGYVSWGQVKDFCGKHGLKETQSVFEFNRGQIH